MNKPTIRLQFIDFWPNPDVPEILIEWLSTRYRVDQESAPDYVIHSVFGTSVLNFPGIRIFFTAENVHPDFNISDYAVSFDWLAFGDRHYRIPLYRFFPEYQELIRPRPPTEDILRTKRTFCAFVCSNAEGAPERKMMFNLLSEYKRVDSGGGWLNNVGRRVTNKKTFQSCAKFVLAFENSSAPGYTTEKIVQAFSAQAIPIYWGNPDVARDFNPKAFINCHDYPSFEAVIEHIIKIDQNDDLWRVMQAEPCFPDGHESTSLKQEPIIDFFSHIFDAPLQQAFRRDRTVWGPKYTQRLNTAFHHPCLQLAMNTMARLRQYRTRICPLSADHSATFQNQARPSRTKAEPYE